MPLMATPGVLLLKTQTLAVASPGTIIVPNPASVPSSALANPGPGDIPMHLVTAVGVDINVTGFAGSVSPSITVFVDRRGDDGNYYQLFGGTPITAIGSQGLSAGLGLAGANSVYLGQYIRIRVVAAGGTITAAVTISVQGA